MALWLDEGPTSTSGRRWHIDKRSEYRRLYYISHLHQSHESRFTSLVTFHISVKTNPRTEISQTEL